CLPTAQERPVLAVPPLVRLFQHLAHVDVRSGCVRLLFQVGPLLMEWSVSLLVAIRAVRRVDPAHGLSTHQGVPAPSEGSRARRGFGAVGGSSMTLRHCLMFGTRTPE